MTGVLISGLQCKWERSRQETLDQKQSINYEL